MGRKLNRTLESIRKLSRVPAGSFTITIPKTMVEALGAEAGEDLRLKMDEEDHITIRRI